jgi:hypothetical protein
LEPFILPDKPQYFQLSSPSSFFGLAPLWSTGGMNEENIYVLMFFVDFCEANKMCPVRETEYSVAHG